MNKKINRSRQGTVYLVGAGPGDPGLMTMRGADILSRADVVVYDRLVSGDLLALSPAAKKIYVGKTRADHDAKARSFQRKINRLLVGFARKGKNVVRLKGGDPFIFGRGGEEAFYLSNNRVRFEVVPGITAGYGAAAYAGIPVTDRRYASEVVFVTGHERTGKTGSSVDWKTLAKIKGTLVFFMSVKNITTVMKRLIREGKPGKTRISVIEWGTLSNQRIVEGTLATIAPKVRREKIASPALMVIGDVNRLRRKLAWFEKKPLFGKKVMITRPSAQSGELKRQLAELGARVIEFPVIKIMPPKNFKPLDTALTGAGGYDWILFTSANAVRAVFERLRKRGKDARHLSEARIAAVGASTKAALVAKGIYPDLVPEKYTTSKLLAALKRSGNLRGQSFLLPRADIAPDFLRQELEKSGATVRQVTAYRTVVPGSAKKHLQKILRDEKIAPLAGTSGKSNGRSGPYVLFTSASTVDNFFKFLDPGTVRRMKSRFVTIGPVTSETLRQKGFRPYRQASEHTLKGLVECLIKNKKNS